MHASAHQYGSTYNVRVWYTATNPRMHHCTLTMASKPFELGSGYFFRITWTLETDNICYDAANTNYTATQSMKLSSTAIVQSHCFALRSRLYSIYRDPNQQSPGDMSYNSHQQHGRLLDCSRSRGSLPVPVVAVLPVKSVGPNDSIIGYAN